MNDLDVSERAILRRETRDMGTSGSGAGVATSGGGILVPVGFVHDVEAGLKYFGPMLNGTGDGRDGYPTVIPTETGQILPWPTSNDTTVVGEIIGEGQQVSTNDVTLGSINFGAFKFSSKMVKVSMELLQDSAFPIEDWLINRNSPSPPRPHSEHEIYPRRGHHGAIRNRDSSHSRRDRGGRRHERRNLRSKHRWLGRSGSDPGAQR